jgi:hypothetical protein
MDSKKSLDEVKIIATLLTDVQSAHGVIFNTRALKLTLQKVDSRVQLEGIGFLTKTLPRLGKAFDKALCNNTKLTGSVHGFKTMPGSELPRFLGEFFSRVLTPQGEVLPVPCVKCIEILRQILYSFYKYKLPYNDEQEQQVIAKFERTEQELTALVPLLQEIEASVTLHHNSRRKRFNPSTSAEVIRTARILLSDVFSRFDPTDVIPRHGPGAVATKQTLWDKFIWSNISSRITDKYPMDAYFFASLNHVCDELHTFGYITDKDLPARVILVPKDSRGPRLISCEPVDFQWIQQGLGRAIVKLVEKHHLTRDAVHFTDQGPNRIGALFGSENGRYSTLDLNEASDRVSLDLVRLMFPPHICEYLEACRSLSTELPDGRILKLRKFAPMGSCLCFPILALSIWAILTAAAPDAYTRDRILVYGDDVIVPTAYAANAIEQLESFGLKVNRDKSCTSGFFRESCGMDAYKGTDVTPVRFRTVWSSTRSPESYASWIAYANQLYDKKYFKTYDYIVGSLIRLYGSIPGDDLHLGCPSLREVPVSARPLRVRYSKAFQKRQYSVLELRSPSITKHMNGWSMLLRWFTEKAQPSNNVVDADGVARPHSDTTSLWDSDPTSGGSVSQYTKRRTSLLVRRWR